MEIVTEIIRNLDGLSYFALGFSAAAILVVVVLVKLKVIG